MAWSFQCRLWSTRVFAIHRQGSFCRWPATRNSSWIPNVMEWTLSLHQKIHAREVSENHPIKSMEEELIESSLSKDKERWIEWNRQRGFNHSDRLAKMIDLGWKKTATYRKIGLMHQSKRRLRYNGKVEDFFNVFAHSDTCNQLSYNEWAMISPSSHSLIEQRVERRWDFIARDSLPHTLIPRAGWEAI